jgi:hypothetical protein
MTLVMAKAWVAAVVAAVSAALPLLLVTIASVIVAGIAVSSPAARHRRVLTVLNRLITLAAVLRSTPGAPGSELPMSSVGAHCDH